MNFEKWLTERGKHGIRGKSSLSKAARQMIFLRRTISSRLSLPARPPPPQDDEFLGDFSYFTNSSGIIDEDCPLYMMMNFHLYSYFYPRSPLVLTNVLFCSHVHFVFFRSHFHFSLIFILLPFLFYSHSYFSHFHFSPILISPSHLFFHLFSSPVLWITVWQ